MRSRSGLLIFEIGFSCDLKRRYVYYCPAPSLLHHTNEQIIIVTHGAFAHFLTEDWDVDDPMTGTAYKNCELPFSI